MHEDSVHAASGETHQDELWLISYVDLLTLLLAFFVLLIASSSLKKARFEQIAASIHGASQTAPLEGLRDQVERMIEQGKLGDRVRASQDNEGLGIEFKDALLFDSGSAEIREEGRKVVADVAALLRDLPQRPVIIEGHTDDVPIRNSVYSSNWELSSARAIHVLEALESSGVLHERLSVRAYAETRQQKTNAPLTDLRSANRRVLVRVE